jgi:L-alanine-DL-glutamate epimerase-like enolase superfamily enzyme
MSNFLILELGFNEVPWRGELLNPPEMFQPGGYLAVPEGPGFGVRLNEPLARRWAV